MSADMAIFFPAIAVAFGLVLGSFFNVLIYRLPRKESIVWPPSHCPHCGRNVRPYENIPLLSYCFLGGKCAGCKKPISFQYPVIELLTGIAAFLAYSFMIVPSLASPVTAAGIITLVVRISVLFIIIPVAVIDLYHFLIPDAITVPGLAIAVLVSFLPGGLSPLDCLLGIFAGGGSLFVVGFIVERIFKKGEAMGGGDVKLMAFCGAVFGWQTAFATILLASLVGSIVGTGFIVFNVFRQGHKIPFGPFLACGLWIAVLAGAKLMAVYQALIDRLIGF
jgi:leader peptidase (prepilin peptidase)/N-methyltransferase